MITLSLEIAVTSVSILLMRLILLFSACFSLSLNAPALAQAEQGIAALRRFEDALKAITEQASPAIVAVIVHAAEAEESVRPFTPGANGYPARFGIGAILRVEGNQAFLLTNAHLVERSSNSKIISLYSGKNKLEKVSIFASDPQSDLAVLRAEFSRDLHLDPLTFSSEPLKAGSITVALGHPRTLIETGQPMAALTICQALGLRQTEVIPEDPTDRLIHDLGTLARFEIGRPLQHSGTVLLDLEGKLVGLVNSLAMPPDADDRTALAIPMTAGFQRIVATLLDGYEVEYGFLGMNPGTGPATLPEEFKPNFPQQTTGIVNRVADQSPAQKAGLEPGDQVLKVNGVMIQSGDDLIREVGILGPDVTAELLIYRPNESALRKASVKLGKWPVYDDTQIVTSNSRFPAWCGLSVDHPTSRRRYLPNQFLTTFPTGVLIMNVEPGSAAEQAGLQVGQFIAKIGENSVETPAEFHQLVNQITGSITLTLTSGQKIEVLNSPPTANDAQD